MSSFRIVESKPLIELSKDYVTLPKHMPVYPIMCLSGKSIMEDFIKQLDEIANIKIRDNIKPIACKEKNIIKNIINE